MPKQMSRHSSILKTPRHGRKLTPHPGEPSHGPLTAEELQLAARNHSMPLEALRNDTTPPGLHYLLNHFDIPFIDAEQWHLRIGGAVQRSLELNLKALRRSPTISIPVTLECAGNGRSLLRPRPLSQPWRLEAVGTAVWTGVPLAYLLAQAGVDDDAVEVVFTGADSGDQGGVRQQFARSLPIAEALRPDIVLAYRMNGNDLPPQHGYPLRLVVPGWYGMASVKWLSSIKVLTKPFDGFQQAVAYRYQQDADDAGTPVTWIKVRSLMVPPGVPDFFTRSRIVPAGPGPGRVPCSASRWESTASGRRRTWNIRQRPSPGARGPCPGWLTPGNTSWPAAPRMPPEPPSRWNRSGTTRAWATTRCSGSR